MKKITFLFLFIIVAVLSYGQSTATYQVTFESTWSQATHPHSSGNLPSSAHWSRLVGATHNSDVSFYSVGESATTGVENIAEQGSNTAFFSEVDTAISNGNSNQSINGPALGTPAGEMVIDQITTTENYPLLTLLSMIAPSPDWMIAIDGVNLLDTNGDWKQSIVLDIYPLDAGTDSGSDYTSANSDTNPKAPIADARGTAPFSSEKIGTMTIELSNILGTNDIDDKVTVSVFPNPFTDIITIQTSTIQLKNIEIYNVLGARVMNITRNISNQTSIDTSNLNSGVYLLRATDIKNNITTKKLIKR